MQRKLTWRSWVVPVAAGELAGFAIPACVGVLARNQPTGLQLALLPAAGLVEGAMLGYAQAWVLRRAWPAFRAVQWVVATAWAAALCWFLGMLPSSTYGTWSTWPKTWLSVVIGLGAILLLSSIGTAQAMVLPRNTHGRAEWVGWTALAWCAGLAAFSGVAPPLWRAGEPFWVVVVIGVAGGLVMALVMASVTGFGAVRLVARATSRAEGDFAPGRQGACSPARCAGG